MPEFKLDSFCLQTPYDSLGAIVKAVTARLDFRTEESLPGYIKANKIEKERIVRANKNVHYVLTIEWKIIVDPLENEANPKNKLELDTDDPQNWTTVQVDVHVAERNNEWTLRNCMLHARQVRDYIVKDFERWYESKLQAMRNTQYGSARWSYLEELAEFNYLTEKISPDCFLAGRYKIGEEFKFITIPAADTDRHGLVCGPTGCGKSATIFAPNLFERIHSSAIVTEATPAGKIPDLFEKTARFRANNGNYVYYFNPDDPRSIRINPIDKVETVGDAQDLADILIRNTTLNSHSGDQVWETAERQLLTALIMLAALQEGSISDVRKMLLKGQKNLRKVVEEMPNSIGRDECLGMFATSSEGFLNGVMVGLMVRLGPWLSPQIAALTSKTDLDLEELPHQLFTFYLAVPSGARQIKPVASLILNFLLDLVLEQLRTNGRFPRPFMMLLDELTNFGYIPDLATQLSIMRHAHVPMVLGMQDTEQLRKVYGMQDAKIILGQTATRIFFRTNELTTARDISQQLGRGTKHEQQRQGEFRFYPRDLMTPDEIMSMSKNRAICFLPEGRPIKIFKLMPELYDDRVNRDPPLGPPIFVDDSLVQPVDTKESLAAKTEAKKEYPKLFQTAKDEKEELENLRKQNNNLEKHQGKFVRSKAKNILNMLGIADEVAKEDKEKSPEESR